MAVSFLVAYSTYNPNQRTLFEASKNKPKIIQARNSKQHMHFTLLFLSLLILNLKKKVHIINMHITLISLHVSSTVIQPCMDHRGEGF